jgi:hypothetical protein
VMNLKMCRVWVTRVYNGVTHVSYMYQDEAAQTWYEWIVI